MADPIRFLFVGGCERSGTTLLQQVLCSHSRIAGGPELQFTWRIADLHHRMSHVLAAGPDIYSKRLEAFCTSEELDDICRDFYSSLFRRIVAQKENALFVSEKTPSNILAASQLLRLFPDSRFVHIVRDGRAVLASHRKVAERLRRRDNGSHDRRALRTPQVCARWNAAVKAHFALLEDADLATRYFWTRFEDLLLEPEEVLGRMFDFLDLELEPRSLHPESFRSEAGNVIVDGLWITEEMDRQGFDPVRIHSWKRELRLDTRVLSSLLMRVNLSRLDYPVAPASPAAA